MDIVEKIRNGAYAPQQPFPEMPQRPSTDESRAAYRLARRDWRTEQTRLVHEVFKNDLAQEHGLVGHPKLERLFQMAWSMGHAAGLEEVASYFEDLSELLKPVK